MDYYEMYTSQQVLPPQVNTDPFKAPHIELQTYVGSYVVLCGIRMSDCELKNRQGRVVIRVISYDAHTNMLCGNVMMLLAVVYDEVGGTDSLGNSIETLETGIAAGICEVVSTCTYVVATPEDIMDVCFVFHVDDVENGIVNGQGIYNCYVYRYHYSVITVDGENTKQLTVQEYVPCFPCEVESYRANKSKYCTASNLWYSMSNLQDEMFRILNRYGDRQQNRYRQKFPFGEVFWDYLKFRTRGVVTEVEVPSHQYRSMLTQGIRRHTVRVKNKRQRTYMLRFESTQQLECLRNILGNTVTIGVRKRRPKIDASDTVRPSTILNVVAGRDNPDDNDCSVTRIDFVNNTHDAHILVLYEDYILNSNAKKLTNRDDKDIFNNQFIKYMLLSNSENDS